MSIICQQYEQPEFSPIKHNTQQGVAVSVVITTKNHEKSIEQCVKSVLAQSLDNIQVYVIDQSSTDDTKKNLKTYLSKYGVKFISVEQKGQLFAQIRGIKEATGQFVTFIDGGDEFSSKDVLKQAYEKARQAKVDTLHFGIQQVSNGEVQVDTQLNPKSMELKAEDWVKSGLEGYKEIYGKLIKLQLVKGITRVNATFEGISKYSGIMLLNLLQLTTKSYLGADFIGYTQKLDNAVKLNEFEDFQDAATAASQLNDQFQAQMPAMTLLRTKMEAIRPVAKKYGYDFCQLYDKQFGFTKYQKGAFGYPEFLFCDEPKKFTVVYTITKDEGIQEGIDKLLKQLDKQFFELAIAINDDLVDRISNETKKIKSIRVIPVKKGASHVRGGSQVAVGLVTMFIDQNDRFSDDFLLNIYNSVNVNQHQQANRDLKTLKGKMFNTKQIRFITQNIREDLKYFTDWTVNLMNLKNKNTITDYQMKGAEFSIIDPFTHSNDPDFLPTLVSALNLASTKCPPEKMTEVYQEVKQYFAKGINEQICKVKGQIELGIETECSKYKVV